MAGTRRGGGHHGMDHKAQLPFPMLLRVENGPPGSLLVWTLST